MNDSVLITERWRWPPSEMWDLDFDEFCLFADAVKELNTQEQEAQKQAQGRK